MRTYALYLIDETIASHYFGKEHLIFQLFKDFEQATGEMQEILSKQISYITKPISSKKIKQHLLRNLKDTKGFRNDKNHFFVELQLNGKAKMTIKDRHLFLEAEGSYEAETIFFEVLRKCEESFMAIDVKNKRYGWLKPIKKEKISHDKKFSNQILYNSPMSSTL